MDAAAEAAQPGAAQSSPARPVAWNNVHRDLQSIREKLTLFFVISFQNHHDNLSVTGNYQVEHKLL